MQGHTVPHWKALRYGKADLRGLSCGSTLKIYQDVLKSGSLLHKQGFVDSQFGTTVYVSGFFLTLPFILVDSYLFMFISFHGHLENPFHIFFLPPFVHILLLLLNSKEEFLQGGRKKLAPDQSFSIFFQFLALCSQNKSKVSCLL